MNTNSVHAHFFSAMREEHIAFPQMLDQEGSLKLLPDHANRIDVLDIAQVERTTVHSQSARKQYHSETNKKIRNK